MTTEATQDRQSYRINADEDQVRREHARLLTLARVVDPSTRATFERVGVGDGWHCCDVGSGAGTVVAWLAERVGAQGGVVSIDVDVRFQPPSSGVVDVRKDDVTTSMIGDREFDLVHARGVLQHLESRESVLDAMVRATKPGGWVVVTDVDWLEFDNQPIPEPFATLSRTMRGFAEQQHGYDGAWGRRLLEALARRGLEAIDARAEAWTMCGGTDAAEWYVGALDRALAVLPREIFPDGFVPEDAIAQARDPRFAILSPLSITAVGRRPAEAA